jgi:hypothetical protein
MAPSRTATAGALFITLAASLTACSTSANRSSAPTTSAGQLTHAQIAALSAPATFSMPPGVGEIIKPISANGLNLASYGYIEQEYFASGMAYALKPTAMPDGGKWTFTPTTPAHYETRVLVRRPTDPAKFDGNVVVEWMNVTAGETAPDWDYVNPSLMDEGAAYVGVSAQALGVNGGKPLLGNTATRPSPGLRGYGPARYAMLHHPGDQYALDMFAQIGEALRQTRPAILGGLQPTHVLATGESQSAFYLTSYADALQPVVPAYQGLFIHSRGGGAVPLAGANVNAAVTGQSVRIRTDLSAPVFMFETQTDLIQLGYAPARQPNSARIRTWEVAGTSHADAFELGGAAVPGVAALGRYRHAATFATAVSSQHHPPWQPGPRRTWQRVGRCADTGRGLARLYAERCSTTGCHQTVWTLRLVCAVRHSRAAAAVWHTQ